MSLRRQGAAEAERDRLELLPNIRTRRQIHYLSGTKVLANDSDKALEEWNAELRFRPSIRKRCKYAAE